MVIVFGLAAVRNELEIGGIFAKLIQMMLLLLLFKAFFMYPDWMKSIYNGFNSLADQANGGTTPSLDAVMDNVGKFWGEVWEKVDDNGWRGLGDTIMLLTFAVIATIFISLMVGRALQYYIFFLFSLYVGVFWLGFGSFGFTRQWAFNAIINIAKQGGKWMTMMLVVGITFTLINNSLANGINDPVNLIILGITSIIMWGFSLGIDGWVDSYFTGHGGGENNYIGGKMGSMAQSAASGAIAGVMGAYYVLFPRARIIIMIPILFFPFFFEIPAVLFLAFWFLEQLFSGAFSLLGPKMLGGIAWWAHIGGFLCGLTIYRFFLDPSYCRRRYPDHSRPWGLLVPRDRY